MAQSSVPAKLEGSTRHAWGYVFEWTSDHQTPEQYNHLKYTCDTLADECAQILNETFPPESRSSTKAEKEELGTAPKGRPKRDLYILLRDNHKANEKLQQLWDEVETIPEWVDWDQVARGQDVLYRYGAATFAGLTYQSLLGGTASSRVTEVLSKTGGFSINTVWRRLLETTQFILECTNDIASIKPGGDGFAACLRVRLLHATVRRRILQIASSHPNYYSVEKNGVPINDLDCIGTIAVFSATIIWQALPRQGIFLRKQEISDYLAVWRLVAYYMGTPTEAFRSPAKAKAMMESLYLYEYTPSASSRLHARNIIRAVENTPPAHASRSYLEASARWLNGDPLADALGLGRPGFYFKALIAGQCLVYMATSYTCRSIPVLDRLQINSFRKIFWSVVRSPESGLGSLTLFEFKYIPKYGVQSEDKGDFQEGKSKVIWTADRKSLISFCLVGFICLLGVWTVGLVGSWAKAGFFLGVKRAQGEVRLVQ